MSADAARPQTVLEVREVTKGFRRGVLRRRRVKVLRGTSLSINGGELVGLVGENGSGKTVLANCLIGLTYGAIGALAGALLGRLGATYFMLFLPMLDLGIAQTPMFGDGAPDGWTQRLPGYGAGRVLVDAAFASSFSAGPELALAMGWWPSRRLR